MDRDDRRGGARRTDDRDAKSRYDRRSRSPPRRDRDDRTRQRSPYRQRGATSARGRSPPPSRRGAGPTTARGPPTRGPKQQPQQQQQQRQQHRQQQVEVVKYMQGEDEDEEAFMARVMGFDKFRTTKNTKVPGNDRNYGVNKVKKAEYRQYMNRVGGFNRPLSPSRQ